MSNASFLIAAGLALFAAYAALSPAVGTDRSSWWTGLLCGVGGLAAMACASAAGDTEFFVSMMAFAGFGAAISLFELGRLARMFRARRR